MTTVKKLILFILCFGLILNLSTSTYASKISIPEDSNVEITEENVNTYFKQAIDLILRKYKFDVSKEELYKATLEKILKEHPELLETAFKGLFDSLDDYSVYYTEEELNSFLEDMSGEFCGIGVLVSAGENGLTISNVYDNSPAKDAELKQGDIITHVGDVFLGGMDIELAKKYIIGPENTEVTITISRKGTSIIKHLTRRKVLIDAGFYQIVENGTIGYIQLTEFNDKAAEFVQKALEEFDKSNIKNIIFDLRSNPGGGLGEFVDVCSLFIPQGPVIHLEYKNPLKFTTLYCENDFITPKYNLAVLVNEYSASAAEAFSAAVQDSGVGIVVGDKTFGKGTMQNITQFKIGGGIKITEAVYLSPNKRQVNEVGVTPDVYAPDKISAYEKADIEPMTYDRVIKIGDTGKDVLAIEERLRIYGFDIGVPDEIFDEKTYNATKQFQSFEELYPYGVMDFTTQAKLDNVLKTAEVRSDISYKKAVEIFKSGNWEASKQDWSNNN